MSGRLWNFVFCFSCIRRPIVDRAYDTFGGSRVLCIFLLDHLAASLAFRTWSSCLKGKDLVMFVDNEASKASLITGSSGNTIANSLLMTQARAECDMSLIPGISSKPRKSLQKCPIYNRRGLKLHFSSDAKTS